MASRGPDRPRLMRQVTVSQCGHAQHYERTHQFTPMSTDIDIDELAQRFNLHDAYDPDDIPEPIREAMEYIDERTGLLGDYHDGDAKLASPETIQWYGRGNYLSGNNALLTWVQEHPKLILGQVGIRADNNGHDQPYAEIHERSRWVSDDE